MRVPPSRPDNLSTNGAQLRFWADTRDKLKQLAVLRKKSMAALLDEMVHAALQAEWDAMDYEEDGAIADAELDAELDVQP